jgi:Peptidase S24-like
LSCLLKYKEMKQNKKDQILRRLALATWIQSQGGMKHLIKDKQLSNNIRSQIHSIIRGYSFGEVAARNLEKKLGIPLGLLDSMNDDTKSHQMMVEVIDSMNKGMKIGSLASDLIFVWNANNIRHYPLDTDTLAITHNGQLLSSGSNYLPRNENEPSIITDFRVSTKWFKTHIPPATETSNLHVITGMSNSENPTYSIGDPILIDAGINIVESDSVYFFKLNNMEFIKRIQRTAGGETRIMHTDDIHNSYIVEPNMDFQVVGKVLKIWKSCTF